MYGSDSSIHKEESDAQSEIRRLHKELKWATGERDILKKPQRTSQSCSTKVRLYPWQHLLLTYSSAMPGAGCSSE